MATYQVTIKNINARVEGMLIPKGECRTIQVNGGTQETAVARAIKKAFPGCGSQSESFGNGDYRQITSKGERGVWCTYGRISIIDEYQS